EPTYGETSSAGGFDGIAGRRGGDPKDGRAAGTTPDRRHPWRRGARRAGDLSPPRAGGRLPGPRFAPARERPPSRGGDPPRLGGPPPHGRPHPPPRTRQAVGRPAHLRPPDLPRVRGDGSPLLPRYRHADERRPRPLCPSLRGID